MHAVLHARTDSNKFKQLFDEIYVFFEFRFETVGLILQQFYRSISKELPQTVAKRHGPLHQHLYGFTECQTRYCWSRETSSTICNFLQCNQYYCQYCKTHLQFRYTYMALIPSRITDIIHTNMLQKCPI